MIAFRVRCILRSTSLHGLQHLVGARKQTFESETCVMAGYTPMRAPWGPNVPAPGARGRGMSPLVQPGRAPGVSLMRDGMNRLQTSQEPQLQQQAPEPKVSISLEEAERLISAAAAPAGDAGVPTMADRTAALDRLRAAVAEGEVLGLPKHPKGALSAEFHSRAFSVMQLAWEACPPDPARGAATSEFLESAYRALEVRKSRFAALVPGFSRRTLAVILHNPAQRQRRFQAQCLCITSASSYAITSRWLSGSPPVSPSSRFVAACRQRPDKFARTPSSSLQALTQWAAFSAKELPSKFLSDFFKRIHQLQRASEQTHLRYLLYWYALTPSSHFCRHSPHAPSAISRCALLFLSARRRTGCPHEFDQTLSSNESGVDLSPFYRSCLQGVSHF